MIWDASSEIVIQAIISTVEEDSIFKEASKANHQNSLSDILQVPNMLPATKISKSVSA